ncbi:MAG: HDOD domain-containing protein [Caldimicrobium sp.]
MGALDQVLKRENTDPPLLPEIVEKILRNFLTKEERELETFFITDSYIRTFLIEMANSPPFKREGTSITDPRLAIIVLGEQTAKISVLGLVSQKLMRTTLNEFSFPKFWARALTQAVAAYFLSDLIEGFPSHLPISAFLMDYGIILLYIINPEKYLKVLSLKLRGMSLLEAERALFGATHPEVASDYFENYAFPRRFILNIFYHHHEENTWEGLPIEIQKDLSLLKMIDHFVGSYFSYNREERWNSFKKIALSYLKEDDIETLGNIFPKIANNYLSFFNLEEFQIKTFKEYEKEKEEEIKKLQISEKEKELAKIQSLEEYKNYFKNKLLEIQRQKTELEREFQLLRHKFNESTIFDELTELYREEYFLRRLLEEILRAKRYGKVFSLLHIILENLENIGKKLGFTEEEIFIKKLSQELKKSLRRVDLIAKAKKWDSFYVLLPETPSHGAMVVARKLLRKIEEFSYKEYNFKSSAFISVLTFDPKNMNPKQDTSPELLVSILKQAAELLVNKQQNRVLLVKLDREIEKKT